MPTVGATGATALAVLGLMACATATTAPSTSSPTATSATYANVAGEWLDTTQSSFETYYPPIVGEALVWRLTQHGSAVSLVDTLYVQSSAGGWTDSANASSSGTIVGDSLVVGQAIAYLRGAHLVLYELPGGCGANDSTASPCDTAGQGYVLTRGTWTPPAPAALPSLVGSWVGVDTLSTDSPGACGPILVGTTVFLFTHDSAGVITGTQLHYECPAVDTLSLYEAQDSGSITLTVVVGDTLDIVGTTLGQYVSPDTIVIFNLYGTGPVDMVRGTYTPPPGDASSRVRPLASGKPRRT